MDLLDIQFAERCERIRRAVSGRFVGGFLGRPLRRSLAGGTEVTEVTDYLMGDDYRYVDWNRAARLDELVTKQFHGAASEDVYLLIDNSGSMQLPKSPAVCKFDRARQISELLGYLALRGQDTVVAATLDGPPLSASERLSTSNGVQPLWRFVNRMEISHSTAGLHESIHAFLQADFRPGFVVLLSDLLDPNGFARPMDALRRYGHDVFVVQLCSPCDAEPEAAGHVALDDIESTFSKRSFIDKDDLQNYRAEFAAFCREIGTYCGRYGLGVTRVSTDDSPEEALYRMLRCGAARAAARSSHVAPQHAR